MRMCLICPKQWFYWENVTNTQSEQRIKSIPPTKEWKKNHSIQCFSVSPNYARMPDLGCSFPLKLDHLMNFPSPSWLHAFQLILGQRQSCRSGSEQKSGDTNYETMSTVKLRDSKGSFGTIYLKNPLKLILIANRLFDPHLIFGTNLWSNSYLLFKQFWSLICVSFW